jgi:NAD(P)-dependent dehydrogenase (short-subunit alcohol dehydrogenase family)
MTVAAFLGLLDAGNQKGNVEQKSQIVITSSIGAYNRVPLGWAYGASKAAVIHLSKQFSTVFSGHDIRSNVIAPGCRLPFPLPNVTI